MDWLVLVAAGLGAMKITDIVKEVAPWPLQPWTRSAVSLVSAGVLVATLSDGARKMVVLTFGAAGVASLIHEIVSVCSMKSQSLSRDQRLQTARNHSRRVGNHRAV